jgi:type IV pilus assembly protein PilY1
MSSFNVSDANAAPGTLQNKPFSAISTSVQPNILFLLDDSGSMRWEYVLRDGSNLNGYVDLTPDSDWDFEDLCFGFNTLAYNPAITYLPWKGKDDNGDDFTDQLSTRALIYPHNTTGNERATTGSFGGFTVSGWVNLEDPSGDPGQPFGYTQWIDTNAVTGVPGDGVYQGANSGNVATNECSEANFIAITSLDAGQKKNLANWYTYYRSRSFVAKTGLLGVIQDSRARVGVAGLRRGTADGIRIKDIDDISLPDGTSKDVDRLAEALINKRALMDQIASSWSSGLTPLSATLLEAGEYFEEGVTARAGFFGSAASHADENTNEFTYDDTIDNSTPILNAANGGTCQANYSILFTDGFANSRDSDAAEVLGAVGNADADVNTPFGGASFADAFSGTTADVAMYYLERNLATSLTGLARIKDIRRAPNGFIDHQHMSTYTIGFGVSGNLTEDPTSPDTAPLVPWPLPEDDSPSSIDDMRHAAWNGRGAFLGSSDPEELIGSIKAVFDDIDSRNQQTTAASSVSSGFIQENSLVFQTEFDSTDWTGNITTYTFDNDGIVDTSTPIFNVQDVLNTKVLSDNNITGVDAATVNAADYTNSRNIITMKIDTANVLHSSTTPSTTNLANGPAVEFAFDGLSASQQSVFTASRPLFSDWAGTDDNVFGRALVKYIQGDSTHEQGVNGELVAGEPVVPGVVESAFRDRDKRYLGAIVNSSPQFVGVPDELYPDQIEGSSPNLYSEFSALRSGRTPIVYVGANDGMLHAFDAKVDATIDTTTSPSTTIISSTGSSGNGVFSYIPGMLTAKLPQLAQPAYNFDSFVDATPTVRDVFVDADGAGAGVVDAWRTFLVGGFRNGGRGIYALDVTDPGTTFASASTTNAKAAEIVRFEYTHADLGYTFSRPQIAKMNDGSWVAIVGNGYNSVGDGKGKLFIIDLETGLPLLGAGGSDGIIDTGEGSIINNLCTDTGSDCNGLSEPTIVDLNGDFKTDRIYAGDLHGNMWMFNVQDTNNANWFATKLITATQTATPCTNCRQPITTRPVVTLHPYKRSISTSPNALVLFGTGQFVAEGDAAIAENQSFYGVWDTIGDDKLNLINNNLTKADLEARTFGGNMDNILVTGNAAAYDSGSSSTRNLGWYIDLAGSIAASAIDSTTSDPFDRGRVVINPVISGSLVFFITTVPSGGVVCKAGQIPGFLTALDFVSGEPADFVVFDSTGNPITSSTVALESGAVGLGFDTTQYGTQTRITNIDGTITQQQISNVQDIPSGRKAWSILR